jgi:hypothetical protein
MPQQTAGRIQLKHQAAPHQAAPLAPQAFLLYLESFITFPLYGALN